MKKISQEQIHKMSTAELEKEIRHHNDLYFVQHKPEISDYDFDQLVLRLKKMKPDSLVLSEVGSDIRKGVVVPKIAHTSLMLSLDKAYTVEEVMDWADKFEGDIVSTPKIDGAAVEIRYNEEGEIALAATRGDGVKGEDISANVRFVENIPKKISQPGIEVRGEIYMSLSVFKGYQDAFANPRNLAAGAIKQKQPRKTGEYRLSFFAYDLRNKEFSEEIEKVRLLKKLGFQTPDARIVKKDEKHLQAEWERFLADRNQLDYELDGVVFKANLVKEQERLGSSSHHPRWAIAYKFQGDSGSTTLRKVEWSVARTRVITPIGIVDPVDLSGAKVSRVSLHNYGMMKKLGVTVPSKVLMVRAGGVIPYLKEVLEKKGRPVESPKKCPSCGYPTEVKDDFLFCTNVKGCRAAKMSELEHFVKTVEIDGFGNVLIEKLYDNGYVEDPSEFYDLRQEDLLTLERMGEILAAKLIGNIQAKRSLSLDVFLQSLGIRELARHSSKILVKEYGTLKAIQGASEEELSALHTIGPVIAREVVEGLQKKKPLIEKLLKHVNLVEGAPVQKGPLAGKTFLFTGKLAAMERGEAEKLVERKGGEIATGVSKDLSYLVIGSEGYKNREKGNKWVKAEKLVEKGAKIRIISEEEFLKMVP
jgi:DNA ligase (NAD+)